MFHIIFIHSSVDGHLRCFYILAIVNSAVVYTGIHVYFWIMMFSGLFSGVGLLLARRLFTSRSSGMKIAASENRRPCCWRCEGLNLILMAGLDPGWRLQQDSVCVHAQSCPTLCNTMDCIACQAPLSMGCPRQEYWSELPFPSPGDVPDSGIEPVSPVWQAYSSPLGHQGSLQMAAGLYVWWARPEL